MSSCLQQNSDDHDLDKYLCRHCLDRPNEKQNCLVLFLLTFKRNLIPAVGAFVTANRFGDDRIEKHTQTKMNAPNLFVAETNWFFCIAEETFYKSNLETEFEIRLLP